MAAALNTARQRRVGETKTRVAKSEDWLKRGGDHPPGSSPLHAHVPSATKERHGGYVILAIFALILLPCGIAACLVALLPVRYLGSLPVLLGLAFTSGATLLALLSIVSSTMPWITEGR